MNRSLVSMSLLAAACTLAIGANDAEARCGRNRHRCCNGQYSQWQGNSNYAQAGAYQSTNTAQYNSAPAPIISNSNNAPMSNTVSKPVIGGPLTNGASVNTYSGYSEPTNVETRPKTSETATQNGPAPAGETNPPAEAPRPVR